MKHAGKTFIKFIKIWHKKGQCEARVVDGQTGCKRTPRLVLGKKTKVNVKLLSTLSTGNIHQSSCFHLNLWPLHTHTLRDNNDHGGPSHVAPCERNLGKICVTPFNINFEACRNVQDASWLKAQWWKQKQIIHLCCSQVCSKLVFEYILCHFTSSSSSHTVTISS